MKLEIDYLKSLFDYDAMTGLLRWKIKHHRKVCIGYLAGTNEPHGYIVVGIDGTTHKAHRIAYMIHYNKVIPDGIEIDHINGVRNDNRICNLREVTRAENSSNSSMRSDNTSGIVGVSWSNQLKKWRARIGFNGKTIELGSFTDKQDAINARKNAEKSYPQYHKNHGKSKPFDYSVNIKDKLSQLNY